MIDEIRAVDLIGQQDARHLLDLIASQYLALLPEELAERPYYYAHQWQEGQAIIYPQVGTLHRAEPSIPGELRRDTLRLFIS